jgi:hypothetical protein
MSEQSHHVAIVDKRPFFEKALSFGMQQGFIDRQHCQTMIADGARGAVQVADFFGSSHLYVDLENARKRIVNLISLYLEHQYNGNLTRAAESLRDNTFLSHSRGGNEMLKALHAMPDSTVFGDVKSQPVKEFQDERTLASLSQGIADARADRGGNRRRAVAGGQRRAGARRARFRQRRKRDPQRGDDARRRR